MTTIQTDVLLGSPRIAVDHAGSGELLLMLHGIGGNRSNWTGQVTFFSQHFHALAWDARGYGDSDDYAGPLDFQDFSRDINALLDYFGADKVHLCGLSLGGRIAQDFYELYPNRVKTLTLVATLPNSSLFSEVEGQDFLKLRLKPLVEDGKETSDIAPTVAKSLAGPNITDEQYRQLVCSMEVLHKESYIKTLRATVEYNNALNLQQVSVPTLLVFGEHDHLTTSAVGRDMAAQIPGSQFVEIPGSGHLINLEQSELFNEVVLEFLLTHC